MIQSILGNLKNNEYGIKDISLYFINSFKGEETFNILIAEYFKSNDIKFKISIINLINNILEQTCNLDDFKNGFATNIDIFTKYILETNNQNIFSIYNKMLDNFILKHIYSNDFLKKYIKKVNDKDLEINRKNKEIKNKKKLLKEEILKITNCDITKLCLDQRLEQNKYNKTFDNLIQKYNDLKDKDIPLTEKEIKIKDFQEQLKVFQSRISSQLKNNIFLIEKIYKENEIIETKI